MLLEYPHRRLHTTGQRIEQLRARYRAFKPRHPDERPTDYRGRERWSAWPK